MQESLDLFSFAWISAIAETQKTGATDWYDTAV